MILSSYQNKDRRNVTTKGTSDASARKASFPKLSNKAQWIELLCIKEHGISGFLLTLVIMISRKLEMNAI
ncbi:hypothetical protein RIF29_36622 [Crotalaria pallida]|uniref:Uncharacterized protein n=1 Tax=Crotalaria pallida TaxID=3830 RepID=A0AAN9EBA6_CROPI